jgi:hypothetical protein
MTRAYLSHQVGFYAVQVGPLVKLGRSKNLRGRLKAYVHNGLTGGLIFPVHLDEGPHHVGHHPQLRQAETFALGLAVRMHGHPARGAEYFAGLAVERAGEFIRTAARSHGWPNIETEELDMPALLNNLPSFGRAA